MNLMDVVSRRRDAELSVVADPAIAVDGDAGDGGHPLLLIV
ncbi:hypothetical protein AB0395_01570 [Streptosporangium sp. NPDC051023]